MKPVIIYFYKKRFNRAFATFDQLGIDRLGDILPEDIRIVFGDDPALLPRADAIVIDLPRSKSVFAPDEAIPVRRDQVMVCWNLECTANYPWIDSPEVRSSFDLFMTYRLDSDVVLPYYDETFAEKLFEPPSPKGLRKNVCMLISSPVNNSGRLEYLSELANHIAIDSYGRWMNNAVIPDDRGYLSKRELMRRYRFTIAFENAIGEDYVTEKFFDPLIAGSVPVYLGAPNIERFAPGANSFINAADYPDPAQLAKLLKELCEDDERYARLLAWKAEPMKAELASLTEARRVHPFIRLAEKVRELKAARGFTV